MSVYCYKREETGPHREVIEHRMVVPRERDRVAQIRSKLDRRKPAAEAEIRDECEDGYEAHPNRCDRHTARELNLAHGEFEPRKQFFRQAPLDVVAHVDGA